MTYPAVPLAMTSGQNLKSSPPSAANREVSTLVTKIFSTMMPEHSDHRTLSISEKLAPTVDQRQLLKHRGRELADSLRTPDEKQTKEIITALVARLLLSYPQSHRGGQDESGRLVGVYVEALVDLPLWAVHAACQGWIRGEGDGDNRFRPSAAELRKLAQRKCIPFRQELEQIKRILNAKVHHEPTPEERQRVIERFQTVLTETMSAPKETAA